MKTHHKKLLLILTFIIFVLAAVLVWQTPKTYEVPDQFEIAGGVPYAVEKGILYEYIGEKKWVKADHAEEVKQLVSGEVLCGIDKNGKLFYGADLSAEELLPLTGGYYNYMAQELLKINADEPFKCIGDSITLDCLVLLADGSILYPYGDVFKRYQLEEQPVYISGRYILTEQGNVFYLKAEKEYAPGESLRCVYDGGDIVEIDGISNTDEMIGLTDKGTVVSIRSSNEEKLLPVSEWKDIATVSQGFHFAVGLTEKGRVLYADYDEESTRKVSEILKDWKDVVGLTVYGMDIYGVKEDGRVVSLNVVDVR